MNEISSINTEGESMRLLMKRFNVSKYNFSRDYRDIKLDLPAPFDNFDLGDRVVDGEITISRSDLRKCKISQRSLTNSTRADMESFFEPCANSIVDLIHGQVELIEHLGRRVRVSYATPDDS